LDAARVKLEVKEERFFLFSTCSSVGTGARYVRVLRSSASQVSEASFCFVEERQEAFESVASGYKPSGEEGCHFIEVRTVRVLQPVGAKTSED
jgi:hypothetical protein